MKVTLIASTAINTVAMMVPGYKPQWVEAADELSEFAGRLCYRSWDRPNPATATNEGYLANILDHQHFSVLEHASATFLIEDVSRALTHELIRHRHFSYSQVSQRFVDSTDAKFVVPPAMVDYDELDVYHSLEETLAGFMDDAVELYQVAVDKLLDAGLSRKQAREAARAFLPNATATDILVTGNMRAWRDFLPKRNNEHADAEIQLLAKELLKQLKGIAPHVFQDMEI